MRKKMGYIIIPALVILCIVGFALKFNGINPSPDPIEPEPTGSITETPTESITDEPGIIDLPVITSTPGAAYLPDPFEGFETVKVVAENYEETADSINVKNFGALGDGVADDYEAILLALEKAYSAGQTLYFPAGTYYVSRRIVLNHNVSILGESMDLVTIVFKDIPEDGSFEKYNQRGLITFVSDSLEMRGMTISYYAETVSAYTKGKTNASGREGTLFSVLKGSNIVFHNCRFKIEEINNPSITCLWVKSEVNNISNISLSECEIINDSAATVGGGVWISAHDSASTAINGAEIKDCYFFKRGNDEAFSTWGYHVNDVYLHDNSFEYSNHEVQNDILIAFGMPKIEREECLRGIRFCNNTITLSGQFMRAIGVQLLTADSDVEISDNIIMCYPDSSVNMNCFRLANPGNVYINRNSIGIDGGNSVAYMSYTYGNAFFSGNFFKTRNTRITMLIRSADSMYYPGVNVALEHETYDLGASNTTSGTPIIQISPSGRLLFDSCKITTIESAIHEIRVQMLYSKDENLDYADNSLDFKNCTSDTSLYLKLSKDSNTSIRFDSSSIRSIVYALDAKNKCIENLEMINTTYESFMCNWKKIKPEEMEGYCVDCNIQR
jgi:hypothetical protein